jgi:hypothetical protein
MPLFSGLKNKQFFWLNFSDMRKEKKGSTVSGDPAVFFL